MINPSETRIINMPYAREKLNFEEVLHDFGYEKSVVNIDKYIPGAAVDPNKPQYTVVWEDMLNGHMMILINDITIAAPLNSFMEVTPKFGHVADIIDFVRDRLRQRGYKSLEDYLEERLGEKVFDQSIKTNYYI